MGGLEWGFAVFDLFGMAPWSELLGLPDPRGARLRALRLQAAALIVLLAFASAYLAIGLVVVVQWTVAYVTAYTMWWVGLCVAMGMAAGLLVEELARIDRGERTSRRGYRPVGEALGLQIVTGATLTMVVLTRLLTLHPAPDAPVHVLYDPASAPRAVYEFGLAPLVFTARTHFGPGSVRIAPLDRQSLLEARRRGQMVLVLSHGCPGGLWTERSCLRPHELPPARRGPHRVYLSGCRTGLAEKRWRSVLAATEITSFPRVSAVPEHLVWLWSSAPWEITALPRRGRPAGQTSSTRTGRRPAARRGRTRGRGSDPAHELHGRSRQGRPHVDLDARLHGAGRTAVRLQGRGCRAHARALRRCDPDRVGRRPR